MAIEDKLEAAQRALDELAREIRDQPRIALANTAARPEARLNWVKLGRYIELSGDTTDAVQSRRKAGKWLDGRECKMVDGRLWIDLRAVEAWIDAW
ncbi:hypothetical protein [Duganella phyllosphaerae]|uniref:Excisionase n=1 Tax=Duganella phyllosphaerae TaxID=762836 RepID=A0A1E7W4Q2_9BURK|nr:hypothetical protein [Duganella phyllosphaerae]OEZ90740.1 hypothetical protein DUPY_53470 [Duganella phyllosphaerae]